MAAKEEDEFYNNAKNYWETIPPTIDGMLGGFPEVSTVDVKTSLVFLRPFLTVCQTFYFTFFFLKCY